MSNNYFNILKNNSAYDTMSLEELKALTEMANEIMKRKAILSKYKINQLPSGQYYTHLEGKPGKTQRKNLKDLEDFIVEYESARLTTMAYLFEGYIENRKKNVAETTWCKEISYFETIIKSSSMSTKPLSELTLKDGSDFLDHCKKASPDMTKKYWRNVKSMLNSFFKFACNQGYITEDPFRNLNPGKQFFADPNKYREEDTVFSYDEKSKVIKLATEDAETKKNAIPLGIVLLFHTGLRIGELCALKWRDIETVRGKLYLHIQREVVSNVLPNGKTKGFIVLPHCKTPKGDRYIRLTPQCLKLLENVKALNTKCKFGVDDNDFIFLRKYKGSITFCTVRCFDPRLRKYCKNSGMKVIKSPHDIRRTVITELYYSGMPIKEIQKIAGHSTQAQTEAYIRFSEDVDDLKYLETLGVSDDKSHNDTSFAAEKRTEIISFSQVKKAKGKLKVSGENE